VGWIQLAIYIFQLFFKIWDVIAEKNKETKAKKQAALKDGLDAIIAKDASRINIVFDRINRLNGMRPIKKRRDSSSDREGGHPTS
jgi:hypothetical protein